MSPAAQLWATLNVGGWGGIRTHDDVAVMPVFKTGAFNRSATHPYCQDKGLADCPQARKSKLAPDWHPGVAYWSAAVHVLGAAGAGPSTALIASAALSSVLLNRCP
jgi:hypothetical protein